MPNAAPQLSNSDSARTEAVLDGVRVVMLALNVPGPVVASKLRSLGAEVVKIEPLAGDPLIALSRDWYEELHRGIEVRRLDLRETGSRAELGELLADADLFITSFRPSSLHRLGLSRETLNARYPTLAQLAIVGEHGARAEIAGHDLTYQASSGLLAAPAMPRTLLADLMGAERAMAAALTLLLAKARGTEIRYAEVSLADAVESLAVPLQLGLTSASGKLGGINPFYRLYRASDAWIAVAALEAQFSSKLTAELALHVPTAEQLEEIFATKTANEWVRWADERDLPIAAVRDATS